MKKLVLLGLVSLSLFANDGVYYFNKAMKYINDKDYKQAMNYFKKSCDLKIQEGCFNVGIMYQKGMGVKENYNLALQYFEKSCYSGNKKICKFINKIANKIFHLIDENKINKLNTILNQTNINITDEGGRTPLMYASRLSNVNMVKYLVSKGADINAKDTSGETALFYAIDNGDINIVKYLVSKGANINVKGFLGRTPLVEAAAEWDGLDIVKYLVSKGADINTKDTNGETALMIASQKGNSDIVKYLVSKGADVNERDKDGFTALMYAAAFGGKLNVVKYLVSKGSDINARDKYGKTVLDIVKSSVFTQKKTIIDYLKKIGAKE